MLNQTQPQRPLKEWVEWWNTKYPVDFLWRLKNKVQFGSQEHKSMDFLSMLFNLIQERDIEEYDKRQKQMEDDEYNLLSDAAKAVNVVKMSRQEIDEAWDDIDLDAINEQALTKQPEDGNTT